MRPHGSDFSDTFQRITDFSLRRLDLVKNHGGIYEHNKMLEDETCMVWSSQMPSLRREIAKGKTSIMGQIILPSKYKVLVYFEVAEEANQRNQRPLFLQLCHRTGQVREVNYHLWMSQDETGALMIAPGCILSAETFYEMGSAANLLLNLSGIIAKEILALDVREVSPENEEEIIWN